MYPSILDNIKKTIDNHNRSLFFCDGIIKSQRISNLLKRFNLDKGALFHSPKVMRVKAVEDDALVNGTIEVFGETCNDAELYLANREKEDLFIQLKGTLPSLNIANPALQQNLKELELPDFEELFSSQFRNVEFLYNSEESVLYMGCMDSNLSLNFLNPFGVLLEKTGFEFARRYKENTLDFRLYSHIPVGQVSVPVTIIPPGEFVSPGLWTAKINKLAEFQNYARDLSKLFQQLISPTQNEFSNRFNFVPEPIQNLQTFAVNDFEMHIIPKESMISFVTTHAQSEESWEILDNLKLDNVGIHADFSFVCDPQFGSLKLFGKALTEKDWPFDVTVAIPETKMEDWILYLDASFNLKSPKDLELIPLPVSLKELQWPQGFMNLDNLSLSLYELNLNPFDKRLTREYLELNLFGDCVLIPDALKIINADVWFAIHHPLDKTKKRIEGEVYGVTNIGGLVVDINGTVQPEGWIFRGHSENEEDTLTLKQLLEGILNFSDLYVVEKLTTLAFKNLEFKLNAQSQEFNFKGESDSQTPIPIGNLTFSCNLKFNVDSKMENGKRISSATIKGKASCGDLIFDTSVDLHKGFLSLHCDSTFLIKTLKTFLPKGTEIPAEIPDLPLKGLSMNFENQETFTLKNKPQNLNDNSSVELWLQFASDDVKAQIQWKNKSDEGLYSFNFKFNENRWTRETSKPVPIIDKDEGHTSLA